jgi:SAM-dependent methyltransferase
MTDGTADLIRQYWDDDAAVYDRSPRHRPTDAAVIAAWTATLERVLPPAPARVLDCGAGTGFLSLIAARLGHTVTALDISAGMLERLRQAAGREGLDIEVIVGSADEPPSGFDAVTQRNLLWTLPDPAGTLRAWREANPAARLVSFGGIWGSADPWDRLLASARRLAGRLKGHEPAHHQPYSDQILSALPLGSGVSPGQEIELALAAGWPHPRLMRLRDVEWAEARTLGPLERLLGVTPRYVVVA